MIDRVRTWRGVSDAGIGADGAGWRQLAHVRLELSGWEHGAHHAPLVRFDNHAMDQRGIPAKEAGVMCITRPPAPASLYQRHRNRLGAGSPV